MSTLRRILTGAGFAIGIAIMLLGAVLLVRTDPLGPFPGGHLSGEEVVGPVLDWEFTNAHATVYVETRPEDPHSVTTVAFVHEGNLYIPSLDAGSKAWPSYVLADPRVRIQVGDRVYSGRAVRVTDEALFGPLMDSARRKYSQLGDWDADAIRERDIWVFRIDPPE